MNTLIKNKQGVFLDNSFLLEELKDNSIQIKVHTVGLCRTDLLVASGKIQINQDNIILGHEFSGVITKINVKSNLSLHDNLKIGDHVCVNPLYKKTGFMGLNFNGCLTEYINVPAEQVINTNSLDFKTAAYLEPVSASLAVLKACHDKLAFGAVYGKNRIAELTYLILKTEGYNIDWISEHDNIKEEYYDYIVETMFNEEDLIKIIKYLKYEGTLVVKSRKKQGTTIFGSDLVEKEINIKCVNYYDFNKSKDWLTKNNHLIQHLLGNSYFITEWEHAFSEAEKSENQKIFIHFCE